MATQVIAIFAGVLLLFVVIVLADPWLHRWFDQYEDWVNRR